MDYRMVVLGHREGVIRASAVVFDKDGVLAGGYLLWQHMFLTYVQEAKKRGLDIDDQARALFGTAYPGSVSPLGLCTMEEAHTLLAAAIWLSHHFDWGTCRVLSSEIMATAEQAVIPEVAYSPLPGAKELLTKLLGLVPVAIASSDSAEHINAMLDYWHIHPKPLVVTTEHVGRPKPYPDMLLFACEKMGVSPQSTVVLGDAVVDVEMAHGAGAKAISVGSHIPGADGWVETLEELRVEVVT